MEMRRKRKAGRKAKRQMQRRTRRRKRRALAVAEVAAAVVKANLKRRRKKAAMVKLRSRKRPKMLHLPKMLQQLTRPLRLALRQQQLSQLHPQKQVLRRHLKRCGRALGMSSTKEITILRSALLRQHGCFHLERYLLRKKTVLPAVSDLLVCIAVAIFCPWICW